MPAKSSNRRSFVVQLMSTAAGAWVGVSTGGLLAWLSGCGSGQQTGTTSAPPPATVADPEPRPDDPQPPATSTMATGPDDPPEPIDAGPEPVDPPPGPVVKYGGPPDMGMPPGPPNEVKPMYGGPSTQVPIVTTKYGGVMRPKYGGPPMPRKYGGPPPDGGVY